ncbi:MAG: heavy-metal-associated domain-containing protein [Firmicutes bacterium]|nr:heavy-metal-associated domain-containing protein [Alicyclobacillaceae bacterium]MCL6498322.1 heavy-metal-associated domain-containing protein [Bacillota bacterium]
MTTYQFRIQGMHCVDCAHRVETALKGVPGVQTARVHYLRRRAVVEADDAVSVDALARAVAEAGYQAEREASQGA